MVSGIETAWHPSLSLLPTVAAGVIAAGLAVYAWRRRHRRAAVPFTVLVVGLSIWSLAYGVQLGFTDVESMVLADKVAFVGSVIVPTAWFLLAVEYAGHEDRITRPVLGVLAVEPVATLALVWTNGSHGLIWREISTDSSGPFTALELTFGPAYWVNFAYSYVLMGCGILLIVGVVVRAGRFHRRQSVLLLVGTVVPFGANAAFHVVPRLNPVPNLDLTTSAFAVTGVVYALALFHFRMLDLVPVARDTLVDRMDDGVVVLASDGHIVDLNPLARAALENAGIGAPISRTVIGDSAGAVDGFVSLDVHGETRSFDVSVTPLSDFRGDEAGRFVLLRDITQLEVLREHQQRLSVLNRVLRHNIGNELTVVTGHCELLAEELTGQRREHLEAISRSADRIVELSEQARHVETTFDHGDSDGTAVDLSELCRLTVERIGERYPEANTAFTGPESAWTASVGRDQLEMVLENLAENAIEHDPSDSPRVRFRVESNDHTTTVEVADDGPGIPELERTILDQNRETPLEHGSGLGLWVVKWIVEAANGTLSFPDAPEGTVVSIELPRSPPPAE